MAIGTAVSGSLVIFLSVEDSLGFRWKTSQRRKRDASSHRLFISLQELTVIFPE